MDEPSQPENHSPARRSEVTPAPARGSIGLTLTAAAAEQASAAMHRAGLANHALRVTVVGGGCSGSQYSLGFDAETRAGDVVIEEGGLRIVVDTAALEQLAGTVIDYVSSLHGAGFKFVNPKASHACGCRSSASA